MNLAMYRTLSGAMTQLRRLEVVSQNLANLNTSGHKGERLAFTEMLTSSQQEAPEERSGGIVSVGAHHIDFSQGQLQPTGNPLDLAIDGEGFFVIDAQQGVRYTRQGTFTLSADGTVVTPLGDPLLGESGAIRVEGKEIKVTPEGAVLSDGVEVDRIQVVRFTNPLSLTKEGQSLFRAPAGQAEAASEFRVLQGNLEQSNVNPIEAMVTLISIQRKFESYQRALQTMDRATEKMISDGARV